MLLFLLIPTTSYEELIFYFLANICHSCVRTNQVLHFVRQLVELLPDYEIASEHEHSNCLLLAQKKVFWFGCLVECPNSFFLSFSNAMSDPSSRGSPVVVLSSVSLDSVWRVHTLLKTLCCVRFLSRYITCNPFHIDELSHRITLIREHSSLSFLVHFSIN